MKIEIQGQDAVSATEELLRIEGLQGSYETVDEVEREGTLATIATIVTIASGTVTIAKEIYEWYQKYQKCKGAKANLRIEKALIIGSNNRRLLLKDATVEQIQQILED
ncbi:hypothetical protein PN499_25715 [Kamptonema animale CS-326]|uniref:hypothetical protein n=1 Tax=Kamptonema animale TaxID=92934 RepID=UPI0023303270|nr:hypothetical protein [Kamptonema animale]MDB9514602.1 hypothetical protein [Kamptonema animale CS-326]